MTDKFPRRIGGDGDGPAETPTERLLREAMTARTSLITAHDLRPAAPPNRRIRRLRPVYAVTVPLLGLAAAMAVGVVTLHGNPVADHDHAPPAATVSASPSPTPAATPTETPSPTATPSETATPTDTGTPDAPETAAALADDTPSSTPSSTGAPATAAKWYTFRGVKFKVPAGWTVAPPKSTDNRVCVLSPGAPSGPQQGWSPETCEPYGVSVVVYNTPDEVTGGAWPTTADLDSSSGWGHQPNCPIWGRPYFPANGYSSVGAPVKTRDIVAGKAINKTTWQVACTPTDTFTAQLWGLSSDQVFIVANGLKPEYQPALVSILDTLDVSGHQPPASGPSDSGDIAITMDGVTTGQEVPNDGTPVTFSVTFKNTSRTSYAAVTPQVYAEPYAGSQPSVHGTLERQDGTAWTPVDLNTRGVGKPGTGGSVPLAPGQSATVKYRLKLTAEDGAGVMPVTAQALVIPDQGSASSIGTSTVPVRVTAK